MESVLLEILEGLRTGRCVDERQLAKLLHRHNRGLGDGQRHAAKKRLLPYYLKVREADPARWARWDVRPDLERQLFGLLRVKPRRTASGVATISVITKPWKCSSACAYCPSDLRMPKSYLCSEPACQRAERNYFDPYLQAASRLRALTQMGHPTDKVELIILGGTWSDYPPAYQAWFVTELFRALNDGDVEQKAKARRAFYKGTGLSSCAEELAERVAGLQKRVDAGSLGYNQAVERLYGKGSAWEEVAATQEASLGDLAEQHLANETAQHRVVGLVVETRPDAVTGESLMLLRRFGCTKVQMGIQSIDPGVLAANGRAIGVERIRESFELLRVFGFKIHAHFMVNLLGSSPEQDKEGYRRFVTEAPYLPDEVKLYPCVLVEGTPLGTHFADGSWRPYGEDELVDVLVANALATPPFIRISRMIRDISAQDIVAGNRKANLRQTVERRVGETGKALREIRSREIGTGEVEVEDLRLETLDYETAVSREFFLQWVTPEDRIAGFLRLSLPRPAYMQEHQADLPVSPFEAMVREVHIYGAVAQLHRTGSGAQHLGLGRQLVEAACALARSQGYRKLNVISSVGTREYYRALGFTDVGLYQQIPL
ncbi:MAG: tRNA uridine(34) 5-carboxymethylaminomethyl modification radical SAM/GNAT enzyme Elp3 [Coriobacteriaceae bacterium]|jgi:elongator complex protein 3|nr:tRNA uridine(34) 5-carboxymethylaminomethyl modification radical SAM/GNAT enzyme Elp3 [Coriobacteriaceae bacterium]